MVTKGTLVRFSDKEVKGFKSLYINPNLVVGVEDRDGHAVGQCDIVYSADGAHPRIYSMSISAEEVAKRLRGETV